MFQFYWNIIPLIGFRQLPNEGSLRLQLTNNASKALSGRTKVWDKERRERKGRERTILYI